MFQSAHHTHAQHTHAQHTHAHMNLDARACVLWMHNPQQNADNELPRTSPAFSAFLLNPLEMDPINFAVVGTASIAKDKVIPALNAVSSTTVVGVFARKRERGSLCQ